MLQQDRADGQATRTLVCPGEPGIQIRGPSDYHRSTHPAEVTPVSFETILYQEDGPIGWLTLNRPDDGNMFTPQMCHEIRDCINEIRRETRTRVLVITGAGDKFFCIGGRKEGMEDTHALRRRAADAGDVRSIDRLQKPVIASVNGFAVGGGNVLQVRVRPHHRQGKRGVPPGGADDGQLRRRLRHLVPRGPGRQEEGEGNVVPAIRKLTAREALAIGLINKVVPDDKLREETRKMALEIAERGAFALASIKAAFNARHGGVVGPVRAWRTTCCCAPTSTPTNRKSWARRSRASASPTRTSSATSRCREHRS